MYEEDFIKRMIRQVMQVVANVVVEIFDLIKAEKFDKALALIAQTRQEFLGLDEILIHQLSAQQLAAMFSVGDFVDSGKLLVMAQMFKFEGDVHASQSEEEAEVQAYLMALDLMLIIVQLTGRLDLAEEYTSIEALEDLLEDHPLPEATLAGLFSYYEATGQYDNAEMALLDWIDASPRPVDALAEGIRFYERLEGVSEHDLEAGGLGREAVAKGLAEALEMQRDLDN